MGRDQRFADRSVVITGGGSGIGRVMSMRFAAEGAAVTVADIVEETAEETVALIEEAAGRGLAVRADVTDASEVDRMVEAATRAFGAVDVLVNNAYSCQGDDVLRMDEETWRLDLAGVVTSAFLCSRACCPG